MRLNLKLSNKLTHKLKLTPQLKLSLDLLQMPLTKLKEYLIQQVTENPLLEIENLKLETTPYNYGKTTSEQNNYDFNNKENFLTVPITLHEHLLKQLRLQTISENKLEIGEKIITNINDDGYLDCSIAEITLTSKTTASETEEILSMIQTFDPIGIGAKDLRECLLIQLKTKNEKNSIPIQIIDKYLSFVGEKKYDYIAKKLNISIEEIQKAIKIISNLEPKPGRAYNTEKTIYLVPDIFLIKNKQKYEVLFNDNGLPEITMNNKYKQMIKQEGTPSDIKEYLTSRLKIATFLINSIKKRKETIRNITEEIAHVQKNFLNNEKLDLKPLTLEHIAKRIKRHKSTVSRAIANKYVQTQWGIFELQHFFSCGIRQENGKFVSSKAIKSEIKKLIENEKKSLTDQEITSHLKQKGIRLARRTTTKYRNQLKIQSSNSR